ncbi:hypothetical protein HanPI659440_Chr15g0581791 [Helianthus annuus]|nr:hypothetical protein HanPI659440_Chr15g0581791 [Helianthus annuus]
MPFILESAENYLNSLILLLPLENKLHACFSSSSPMRTCFLQVLFFILNNSSSPTIAFWADF